MHSIHFTEFVALFTAVKLQNWQFVTLQRRHLVSLIEKEYLGVLQEKQEPSYKVVFIGQDKQTTLLSEVIFVEHSEHS